MFFCFYLTFVRHLSKTTKHFFKQNTQIHDCNTAYTARQDDLIYVFKLLTSLQ